ncbi:hypothetical protein BH11PSE12_BH11PSE12_16370 [soil metagenome]
MFCFDVSTVEKFVYSCQGIATKCLKSGIKVVKPCMGGVDVRLSILIF